MFPSSYVLRVEWKIFLSYLIFLVNTLEEVCALWFIPPIYYLSFILLFIYIALSS